MGLFTSFGKHVKGLLGDDAFADRLAQAQAFANGDPATAAAIGASIRKRRAAEHGTTQMSPEEPYAKTQQDYRSQNPIKNRRDYARPSPFDFGRGFRDHR